MTKCKKCNVEVDNVSDVCPLCKSHLDMTSGESSYPKLRYKFTSDFVRKLVLFIVSVLCISVLIINRLLTPNIKWASFVALALVCTYIIFRKIMNGHKKVLKLLFSLNFLIIVMAIVWDYYTGYRGWSINYLLPVMCISYGIFLIVLRFVSYFAFRENSTYIYLNVLLEFVPLILLHYDIISFAPLAIISGILGIINLLILVVFDGSKFKDDLEKKLHI